jgi:hypothetical protein
MLLDPVIRCRQVADLCKRSSCDALVTRLGAVHGPTHQEPARESFPQLFDLWLIPAISTALQAAPRSIAVVWKSLRAAG